MSLWSRLATLAALTATVGCGGATETGTVTGEVTVDGQPLKTGLIRFVSADGKAATDGPVADGKFSVAVPAGEMKVSISGSKVVGKKKMYDTPDAPTVDETVELLPPRYNTQTELRLTVKAGTQTENYKLTTGKAK